MLYLIRHGEAEGNAEGRVMGQLDLPLTTRGREEAEALGAWCTAQGISFTAVFTSDLARARDTAAILATATRSPTPLVRTDLREVGRGQLEGMTYAEAAALRSAALGLEPEASVTSRIARVARELRRAALHGPVAAVGHGGSLARLLRFYLGLRPEPGHGEFGFSLANTGVSILDFQPPRPNVHAINALPHLPGWRPRARR